MVPRPVNTYFSSAFYFMSGEAEEDYQCALSSLKRHIYYDNIKRDNYAYVGLPPFLTSSHQQDNKIGLDRKTNSISFVNFLVTKAHSMKLSIGPKAIPSLLPVVNFA
jgi:hypothetical protein